MSAEEQAVEEAPAPTQSQADYIIDAETDEVLRLHLDKFEGPLEVLLYLIKAQEIDIFDIPILKITEQYLRFLDLMQEENLDVTGEFLVIAATLIQIKSRMLLPDDVNEEDEDDELEEEDPRLELVTKLLEYRQYKEMTEKFERMAERADDWFSRSVKPKIAPDPDEEEMLDVTLYDLLRAFKSVLRFLGDGVVETVYGEEASVDDKIVHIEDSLARDGSASWTELFRECRSRVEMVCCFLAILELCKMGRIRANQSKNFDEIRIFPVEQPTEALAV